MRGFCCIELLITILVFNENKTKKVYHGYDHNLITIICIYNSYPAHWSA